MKKFNIYLFLLSILATHLFPDNIYGTHNNYIKLNFTYKYQQYYILGLFKKNHLTGLWKNKDFSKVISFLEFEQFITEHKISSQMNYLKEKILFISTSGFKAIIA